jgi:hypothetical protein
VGVAFAAIGIGALVPAAIMSWVLRLRQPPASQIARRSIFGDSETSFADKIAIDRFDLDALRSKISILTNVSVK